VELVQRYAQPTRGRNSVQIELNRSLFMDEETGEKSKNYAKIQEHIQRMMAFVSVYVQGKMTSLAAD
jgi:N-formylglutamate deformylase